MGVSGEGTPGPALPSEPHPRPSHGVPRVPGWCCLQGLGHGWGLDGAAGRLGVSSP